MSCLINAYIKSIDDLFYEPDLLKWALAALSNSTSNHLSCKSLSLSLWNDVLFRGSWLTCPHPQSPGCDEGIKADRSSQSSSFQNPFRAALKQSCTLAVFSDGVAFNAICFQSKERGSEDLPPTLTRWNTNGCLQCGLSFTRLSDYFYCRFSITVFTQLWCNKNMKKHCIMALRVYLEDAIT